MGSLTRYLDPTDTNPHLSPIIWDGCPAREELMQGPRSGWEAYDDFTMRPDPGTITTQIDRGMWQVFGGATGTLLADELRGVVRILTSASNEATNMVQNSQPFQISQNLGKVFFEIRLNSTTITTNETGWFVGLYEQVTGSATVPLSATSVLTDNNLVGFHKPEANTTAFDFSYKADGITLVEMESDIGTLAAATFIKLGFVYDPTAGTTGTAAQLVSYINGAQQANPKTIPNATGTDFPADVRMGLILAIQGITAADQDLSVDWVRCVQLDA